MWLSNQAMASFCCKVVSKICNTNGSKHALSLPVCKTGHCRSRSSLLDVFFGLKVDGLRRQEEREQAPFLPSSLCFEIVLLE